MTQRRQLSVIMPLDTGWKTENHGFSNDCVILTSQALVGYFKTLLPCIFHCCYLHLYLHTYYSFPLVLQCKYLLKVVTGTILKLTLVHTVYTVIVINLLTLLPHSREIYEQFLPEQHFTRIEPIIQSLYLLPIQLSCKQTIRPRIKQAYDSSVYNVRANRLQSHFLLVWIGCSISGIIQSSSWILEHVKHK